MIKTTKKSKKKKNRKYCLVEMFVKMSVYIVANKQQNVVEFY